MFRSILLASVLLTAPITSAEAAEWAKDLFKGAKTTHDFGTVARGADVIHRFQLKNGFKEDIRIVSVRSTCGCTLPSIETSKGSRTLKQGEVGSIVARLNTSAFVGKRSATLTATFEFADASGNKHLGEAQFRVEGNIQGNLVFKPKSVRFAGVRQGDEHLRQATITRLGSPNWRIQSVLSPSKHVAVHFKEKYRGQDRVEYQVQVQLKASALAGYFRESIILTTTDRSSKRIHFDIEGRVVSTISAGTSPIVFHEVPLGELVSRQIVVHGRAPFTIVGIDCPDDRFTYQFGKEPAKLHHVKVTFRGKGNIGKVTQKIRIRTDRGIGLLTAYVNVTHQVIPTVSDHTGGPQLAHRKEPADK